MEAMRGERYPEAMTAPIPQGVASKQAVDDYLASNIVEPLADRGWPNLGAALATPPSVAADLLIPQQGSDLAMPGVAKLGRMAKSVGKKAFPRAAAMNAAQHEAVNVRKGIKEAEELAMSRGQRAAIEMEKLRATDADDRIFSHNLDMTPHESKAADELWKIDAWNQEIDEQLQQSLAASGKKTPRPGYTSRVNVERANAKKAEASKWLLDYIDRKRSEIGE
jgi:hypothetical protein